MDAASWCQRILAGYRDVFAYRDLEGYRSLPFRERKRLDAAAIWRGLSSGGLWKAVLIVIAWSLVNEIIVLSYDLAGWRRELLRCSPLLLVLPWIAAARRRHIGELLQQDRTGHRGGAGRSSWLVSDVGNGLIAAMKALLKIVFYLVGGIILLGIALSLAVLFLFDPNDYREQLAAAVEAQTGRSMTIEGELSLGVFPCCSVNIGRTALSNPAGFADQQFVSIEAASVSLKLVPLILERKVEIGMVQLDGLQAHLIQRADGAVNWTFEGGSEGVAEPSDDAPASLIDVETLYVGGIEFEQGSIRWQDEVAGADYRLENINVETGEIITGQPFELDASFRVLGLAPDVIVDIELDSQVALDADAGSVQATEMQGSVKLTGSGVPADSAALMLSGGSLFAGGPANDLRIEGLDMAIEVAGLTSNDVAPDLIADLALNSRVEIDGGAGSVRFADVNGRVDLSGAGAPPTGAALMLSGATVIAGGAANEVRFDGLVLTAEVASLTARVDGEGVIGEAQSTLRGNVQVEPFSPQQLLQELGEAQIGTTDPEVLRNVELSGAWFLDGDRAGIEELAMTLDDTHIDGWARVESLETRALGMELNIDSINVDRYLAPTDDGAAKTADTTGKTQRIPDEDLRALNIPKARVTIGEAIITGFKLKSVKMEATAKDGLIQLQPLNARLYGGKYRGDVRINVTGNVPRLGLNHTLTGVRVRDLIKARSGPENLSGLMNLRFKGKARGRTMNAMLRNLEGETSIELIDGVYHGVDLWHTILTQRARIKGDPPPPAPKNPQTEISELTGTGTFSGGVLKNDDFSMATPFMRMNGAGDVNLLAQTLDYRVDARVVKSATLDDGDALDDLEGIVLPIELKGPINSPDIGVDLGTLAASYATKKLQDRLLKKLGGDEKDNGEDGEAQEESPRDQLKRDILEELFD